MVILHIGFDGSALGLTFPLGLFYDFFFLSRFSPSMTSGIKVSRLPERYTNLEKKTILVGHTKHHYASVFIGKSPKLQASTAKRVPASGHRQV